MPARPPGRPRNEAGRAAVLTACAEIIGERGYEGLTMGEMASRAAVARQTVYRWWPSKAHVVVEAALEGVIEVPSAPLPDTGDLEADLRGWMRGLLESAEGVGGSAVIRALAAATAADAEAGDALWQRFTGPLVEETAVRLEAARARGQVRTGVDLVDAAEALHGFRLFITLARQPLAVERATSIVDLLLKGLTVT